MPVAVPKKQIASHFTRDAIHDAKADDSPGGKTVTRRELKSIKAAVRKDIKLSADTFATAGDIKNQLARIQSVPERQELIGAAAKALETSYRDAFEPPSLGRDAVRRQYTPRQLADAVSAAAGQFRLVSPQQAEELAKSVADSFKSLAQNNHAHAVDVGIAIKALDEKLHEVVPDAARLLADPIATEAGASQLESILKRPKS